MKEAETNTHPPPGTDRRAMTANRKAKERKMNRTTGTLAATLAVVGAVSAGAQESTHMMDDDTMRQMMSTGLILPKMDAAGGRELFAANPISRNS